MQYRLLDKVAPTWRLARVIERMFNPHAFNDLIRMVRQVQHARLRIFHFYLTKKLLTHIA
jgi:hypothetical protein